MAPYTQLYVHLVWATWDRLPLIAPEVEPRLYAALAEKCRALGCQPLGIGGIADHVHVLAGFPATITIAKLVGELKGASSHLMTHELAPGAFFKWQGAYGAFTVSEHMVSTVVAYIRNQKEHHRDATTLVAFEMLGAETRTNAEQ
ncbi:IS200/IS605 family transposase [Candidatus Chloroploca mongolica]|uniref:IS200/IS605 family transposase n=1 Tax=Candidatus Chloroploca mongolica TaxID=2528176 RepID=UPI001080B207|nr:IS200/IS605 family transposase [Candidatus Chloroploca mongolica]